MQKVKVENLKHTDFVITDVDDEIIATIGGLRDEMKIDDTVYGDCLILLDERTRIHKIILSEDDTSLNISVDPNIVLEGGSAYTFEILFDARELQEDIVPNMSIGFSNLDEAFVITAGKRSLYAVRYIDGEWILNKQGEW